MKKWIFFNMTLMVCFTVVKLSSEENVSHDVPSNISHGSQTYGKETVEKVQANGLVKLNGTKVTKHLQVNGSLKAENAQIEEMQVNGQATLDHCLIKQKSNVCGALIATDSRFEDELSVSSERAVFDACELTSLHILRVRGYCGVQVVELKAKTKIDGPITFDGGKGEVIADSDTKISGRVIGGKIRK